MFECYENELKKRDYNFIIDKFLRITISILFIFFILTNIIFWNYFFLIISFISFCLILWITINIFVNKLLIKNKLNYKKVNWEHKISSLKLLYENRILKYFLEILKENNINSEEKIYNLYKEYKTNKNYQIVINEKQSVFVIATTIITIFIQTYNSNSKTFDGALLFCCFLIFWVA